MATLMSSGCPGWVIFRTLRILTASPPLFRPLFIRNRHLKQGLKSPYSYASQTLTSKGLKPVFVGKIAPYTTDVLFRSR